MSKHLFIRAAKIVGQHFLPGEVKEAHEGLNLDGEATIEWEEANEHDPHACIVYLDGVRLGYVEKNLAPSIALMIRMGFKPTATCTRIPGKLGNFAATIYVEPKA